MYQYSENVNIYNPYGYINDPDTGEQNLFCGDPNENTYVGSYQNAADAIEKLAIAGEVLACNSFTFHCNNFTNTNDNSCNMIQTAVDDEDFLAIGGRLYECFPTALVNLYENSCLGTCPNSPTSAPSAAPTFSPTIPTSNPSAAPSTTPTLAPSLAPSVAPTIAPSSSPTSHPTPAPTDIPTMAPSLAPSSAPSLAPSIAPTESTDTPTNPPTTAPSVSPTATPTITPSAAPTSAPSLAPSISPTIAPTGTPTIRPSPAPSGSPSAVPTLAPTLAPTRFPTAGGRFDHFIKIVYKLSQLTDFIKRRIASNRDTVILIMQSIIERGYWTDGLLAYEDFQVKVTKIDEDKVGDIRNNSWLQWPNENQPLTIECEILCLLDDCIFITRTDMNTKPDTRRRLASAGSAECDNYQDFQPLTQCNLREYFGQDDIIFEVENSDSFSSESVDCIGGCIADDPPYVLYGIMGFLGLMVFISILAFLYNKRLLCSLPGFNPVDSAQWTALIIFGIQAWDFISDINLAFEIFGDLNGNGINDRSDEEEDYAGFKDANLLIVIAFLGSSLSIIIPYIVNLGIAANIKKLIRKNSAAKAYFQNYAAIYVIFVVLSGGAYPALAVVSSNIFGLTIFNSGLTRFELKRLSKIKIFGTIILENLPQLACQIIYSIQLETITQTTQLAFIASVLSMTASTLSYFVEQNAADTTAVQYYLLFQCGHTERKETGTSTKHTKNVSSVNPYDGDEKDGTEHFDLEDKEDYGPNNTSAKFGLSEEERNIIWKRKGLKSALSGAITQAFGISPQNIEIGKTKIIRWGIIVHIVHYVYESDLEEQKMDAPSFTQQLYAIERKEIDDIFRKHYGFDKDFSVSYHSKSPDTKSIGQSVTVNADEDEGDNDTAPNERRSALMRKMKTVSHRHVMMKFGKLNKVRSDEEDDGLYDDEDGDYLEMVETGARNKDSDDIKNKLEEIMNEYGFKTEKDKKEFLSKWMDERQGLMISTIDEEKENNDNEEYYYHEERETKDKDKNAEGDYGQVVVTNKQSSVAL